MTASEHLLGGRIRTDSSTGTGYVEEVRTRVGRLCPNVDRGSVARTAAEPAVSAGTVPPEFAIGVRGIRPPRRPRRHDERWRLSV